MTTCKPAKACKKHLNLNKRFKGIPSVHIWKHQPIHEHVEKEKKIQSYMERYIWNADGTFRTDAGAFEDTFRRDVIFYSETHECPPTSTLPSMTGYHWESVHWKTTRFEYCSGGSGGVAVLDRKELRPIIQVMRQDAGMRKLDIFGSESSQERDMIYS